MIGLFRTAIAPIRANLSVVRASSSVFASFPSQTRLVSRSFASDSSLAPEDATPSSLNVVQATPKFAEPVKGRTMVLQLRLKSYHKFYLNRFVSLLNTRFQGLGLSKPSQVFLPKKIERFTVLRGPHIDKKARDQFERITHKRLISFNVPGDSNNIELAYRLLQGLTNLAPGVEIRAKYLVSLGAKAKQ